VDAGGAVANPDRADFVSSRGTSGASRLLVPSDAAPRGRSGVSVNATRLVSRNVIWSMMSMPEDEKTMYVAGVVLGISETLRCAIRNQRDVRNGLIYITLRRVRPLSQLF
jgi:hypothetical protein